MAEEYTLVTVADYVLKHTPGNTVSNLGSTRALHDGEPVNMAVNTMLRL